MTGLSRRGFFRLAAGAAVLTQLPAISKASATIYADGINCDAAGLEALLRGEVVEFANAADATRIGWRDGCLRLDADLLIRRTVRFPKAFHGTVAGGHITAGQPVDVMLDLSEAEGGAITGMWLDGGDHDIGAGLKA